MGRRFCEECHQKQKQIDRLEEETRRLKDLLNKMKKQTARAAEGFFGSSTPSSKIPLKANAPAPEDRKRRGGQPGHPGAGRRSAAAAEYDKSVKVPVDVGEHCPSCGGILTGKGTVYREVLESRPIKADRIQYLLPKRHCARCPQPYLPAVPGVLPKSLFGNQLITTALELHYLHGIPLGRVSELTGIDAGSLMGVYHRVAKLFQDVPAHLIKCYREAPVRHADETGWRKEGQNGYAWLFATRKISLFQFKNTRSATVPRAVLGDAPLPGVLVVDRYAGYNKAPCAIQYCYAHLLRDLQDLDKEFPAVPEVKTFVSTLAPLLATAMGLRNQAIAGEAFPVKAAAVKADILAAVNQPAKHLGIRRIQDIFHQNAHRLYHWADNKLIPADNNLAERDLRPTVIARKVSFGSQSDAGALTRGILMSTLWSLRKQVPHVSEHVKRVLDQLALNIRQNPLPLLFPGPSPPKALL